MQERHSVGSRAPPGACSSSIPVIFTLDLPDADGPWESSSARAIAPHHGAGVESRVRGGRCCSLTQLQQRCERRVSALGSGSARAREKRPLTGARRRLSAADQRCSDARPSRDTPDAVAPRWWDDGFVAWSLLIVDDHADFRAGATALLETDGFHVLGEASDGEAALEAVRRLRPQNVLLDIQLPGMDGFAVADSLALGDEPPIVVLTSSRPEEAFRSRLRAARSVRGFIAKADLSTECLSTLVT